MQERVQERKGNHIERRTWRCCYAVMKIAKREDSFYREGQSRSYEDGCEQSTCKAMPLDMILAGEWGALRWVACRLSCIAE